MKSQIEQRLQQLQQEYESGQKMMVELQNKQADLQQTLLRISGAMQVLQEVLEEASKASANGSHQLEEMPSLGETVALNP